MAREEFEKRKEELINLYFDNELGKEEKIEVEKLIATEESWAEYYTALKSLDTGIKELHKYDRQIDILGSLNIEVDSGKTLVERIKELLFLPKLSPAFGLALILVAIFASWALFSTRLVQEQNAPQVAVKKNSVSVTEAGEKVMVRFVLYAPNAKQVSIAGDFNKWNDNDVQLDDIDGDGYWTVVIPISRGEHEYQFVINGTKRISDPLAALVRPDGFGGENSVISF